MPGGQRKRQPTPSACYPARMPGYVARKRAAAPLPVTPQPAQSAGSNQDDKRSGEDVLDEKDEGGVSAAAWNCSLQPAPPEQQFSCFVFEPFVGLHCCCSVGSVRNADGFWTELLLLASDAHDSADKSLLSGGLTLGTFFGTLRPATASDSSRDDATFKTFQPLPRSNDTELNPTDLQCHAVDEAGEPLQSHDRHVRVSSMHCINPLSIEWSLREEQEVEVLVAVGRRNGMVQLLHIPLHCDHDTCSISISFRKQIRISNPYIKLAALRMLGPAVHTSAFVSSAAPDTCVIASHGSSGHFSLWQLLHNPCSSYARCFLCPSSSSSSSSSFLSEALASFCYRRTDRSICIVAARASAVEIWLYPAGSLARDTSAAAAKGDDGTLVASVPSGPCCITALAALRFESEACRALGGSAQAAVSFVIGFDDGSLRELHVDVWGDDVSGSVSCWVLPSLRSVTERCAVKFIRPWHHGSCLFVCAWADGCVRVFSSQGDDGIAQPASEMHRLCPGSSLSSMSVSDGAMVYITCANSLIFANLGDLLDLAQISDA